MVLLSEKFDVIANLTGFIVGSRPIDRQVALWGGERPLVAP
jgi:hypothetical protein